MRSTFGFKNYHCSKYKLLLILRFKGAAIHPIPVLTSTEREGFFCFRDQLERLEREGLIGIADQFSLNTSPKSLQLPDLVVSLTTKGVEVTNNYMTAIITVVAGIATTVGVIHGFFKS